MRGELSDRLSFKTKLIIWVYHLDHLLTPVDFHSPLIHKGKNYY